MADRELYDLLRPEEKLAYARIQAIQALGSLAGMLGSDETNIQALADRLRSANEDEAEAFRKNAAKILQILGIAAPNSIQKQEVASKDRLEVTEDDEQLDTRLEPISDLLEQNRSLTAHVASEGIRVPEFQGGPWLQRVTTAELDRIDSTDQAVCHIREAVFEIIELLGLDPEYINIDLCSGMLERIQEKEVTAFDVTDDYLEQLVRTSLDYRKTVPMSSQIVNSICFWASLKGVPFTALLPYRKLTWPPDRDQGPTQGNVTSSRYFVEGYVKSARYDAAQLASKLAKDAERERVDRVISEIAEGLQNDSDTDAT